MPAVGRAIVNGENDSVKVLPKQAAARIQCVIFNFKSEVQARSRSKHYAVICHLLLVNSFSPYDLIASLYERKINISSIFFPVCLLDRFQLSIGL